MRRIAWNKVRGYLAAGVALIACPCHLIVTLPLFLGLMGGTAAGAYLEQNIALVFVVSTLLFVGGLVLAFRWLGRGVSGGVARSTEQSRAQTSRLASVGLLQEKEGEKKP